jgi:choline dehydrogenase-like flavoprotein
VFRDARELPDGAVIESDVCIIGAGAAGITLARDLSGSGLRVCLLEGGGLEPDGESQGLYRGRNTGLPYVDLEDCRLRYFGGTTNHWGGWCRPLDPEDFEPHDWLAHSGWPLRFEDLRPYYLRAQRTCEIGGFEYDAKALSRRGGRPLLPLDASRVASLGYHFSPPTRFGTRYHDALVQSANVTVWLHANLVNIRLDAHGARVEALQCATLGGRRFTVRAGRHVLALGAIENARLLLASSDRRPEGVGNAEGLVGRYFMEHPHLYRAGHLLLDRAVDASFYRPHSADTFDEATDRARPVRIIGALGLPGPLRIRQGILGMACTLTRLDLERIDERERFDAVGPSALRPLLKVAPGELALYEIAVRSEQSPIPESRVRLIDEHDALGLPRCELVWRLGDRDLLDVQRTLQRIGAELGRSGIGRLWLAEDADGRFAPPRIDGGCHHMGTTRMSADRRTGVVDADGRVHGCPNLYIAGSSVFPTGGFANPTLTIVALAHRLADHLRNNS